MHCFRYASPTFMELNLEALSCSTNNYDHNFLYSYKANPSQVYLEGKVNIFYECSCGGACMRLESLYRSIAKLNTDISFRLYNVC